MKNIKVSTREILLVAFMMIAVLYGAYQLFIASASKPVDKGNGAVASVEDLTTKVSSVLGEAGTYTTYAAIIAAAEGQWAKDPFYRSAAPAKRGAPKMGPVVYTGYLEIGNKRIAVIDSESYETGDELELGGYIVKDIKTSAVVLQGKGTTDFITVPLLEE